MKKYLKEIVILFIQLLMFYIFLIFMYLYEPINSLLKNVSKQIDGFLFIKDRDLKCLVQL